MKFLVDMVRIGYGFRGIEVDASNEKEAREKVMDIAGDYEFSEHDADYEIDSVEEIV